jgi:hypothetical protein
MKKRKTDKGLTSLVAPQKFLKRYYDRHIEIADRVALEQDDRRSLIAAWKANGRKARFQPGPYIPLYIAYRQAVVDLAGIQRDVVAKKFPAKVVRLLQRYISSVPVVRVEVKFKPRADR